jgi:hypothetical protein
MVLVSSATIESACGGAFKNGLKNLVITDGVNDASKTCLICDPLLLERNEDGFLTKKLAFKSLHLDLKEYYSYSYYSRRAQIMDGLAGMFLSPCGDFDESKGFNCGTACCKMLGIPAKSFWIKLPMYRKDKS